MLQSFRMLLHKLIEIGRTEARSAHCGATSWLEMYVCRCRKFTKTPILGVEGRSRSSMLVPLESSSAVLVMICSKSASTCNRFHARWANSDKIKISKGRGYPSLMPSFEANLFTHWHQMNSLETRDSRLSYAEDPESLSHLGFVYHRVVTDRRTDRIPIASTRLSSTCRYSCGA